MKKYILMALCAMLLTGCAAKKSEVITPETVERWGANINESILHETITYENVEIETYDTNTSNWD